MIAKTHSAIPFGYEGRLVEVEGDTNRGLPSFNIVGLGSKTINEARERVRAALANSGFTFPDHRVTINLAPAELTKDGSHLDLPIALTILALSGQIRPKDLAKRLFVGELSLTGELRPVRGIINVVEAARQAGITEIFLPVQNLPQASLVPGVNLIGVTSLRQLFQHLKHQLIIQNPPVANVVKNTETDKNQAFLDHIRGQASAKRAIAIAIAGHHNILLSGPPGAGKTLLARATLGLLPPLTPEEQISVTKIHSIAAADTVITSRPFRSPHHTASATAIIGSPTNPGEISLAHLGVLFLDELPEYPRAILESLRQPLEDRRISLSRARLKTTYPADFMLIATMNPCPCGYAGDPAHACTCTPTQILNYHKKLSGPLLDRIDLVVNVEKVKNTELAAPTPDGHHEHDVVKNTITEAIARQHARYQSPITNASLSSHQITHLLKLTKSAEQLLCTASERLNLSARSYFKVIKVARTIADLDGHDLIDDAAIAEALSYRTDIKTS